MSYWERQRVKVLAAFSALLFVVLALPASASYNVFYAGTNFNTVSFPQYGEKVRVDSIYYSNSYDTARSEMFTCGLTTDPYPAGFWISNMLSGRYLFTVQAVPHPTPRIFVIPDGSGNYTLSTADVVATAAGTGFPSFNDIVNYVNTHGSGAATNSSTNIIYASALGARLNSDVYSGGGTDDSAIIQSALDRATNHTALEVIIDGPALISTNLIIRSNTKLRFLPGAGLFMAAHANCTVLGNQQNTNYSTTNVVVEGGILNANGNSQSEYVTNGYRLSGAPGVWGVWFAGVDGLTLRDVKLMNSKTYQFLFNDSRNILMENCWVYCTNNPTTTNTFYGNDGVHLMGNLQNFTCRNFRYTHGGDDAFAIMTDETDQTLPVRDPRWTTNSGSMSNIVFDTVWVESGKNIGKMQWYGSTNACAHNVTIRNVHGDATTQGFIVLDFGGGLKANNFVMDGYDVVMGGNADGFGNPMLSLAGILADTMRLSNIRILDRAGGGIGSYGIIGLSSIATNKFLSNIYVEGSTGSAGAGDAAITFLGAASTNQPFTSIENLTALKMYSVLDALDGSGETPALGVFKLSNVQYSPTSILNGGGFTNFTCDLIGNGSGISNLTGANVTGTLTNNTTGNATTATSATSAAVAATLSNANGLTNGLIPAARLAGSAGTSSIALGQSADSTKDYSVSIGAGANAFGTNSSALGRSTAATASNASAFGEGAQAGNADATAIGQNAVTTATNQIMLGLANGTVNVPGSLVASGASLTNLNASQLATGTVPSARLSLTSNDIPLLDAKKLVTGILNTAQAGSITQHSDVKITGTAPAIRDMLIWDGTNWTNAPSMGYTIDLFDTANNSMAANTTYYYGKMSSRLINTSYGIAQVDIPRAGRITRVQYKDDISATLGSGEVVNFWIEVNNATDVFNWQFAMTAAFTNNVVTGSQAVAVGDTIVFKVTTPATWATPATSVRLAAQVYIEP